MVHMMRQTIRNSGLDLSSETISDHTDSILLQGKRYVSYKVRFKMKFENKKIKIFDTVDLSKDIANNELGE